MLHLLYLVVFTILAFLAIANMIRSLLTISSMDTPRRYPPSGPYMTSATGYRTVPHPELLDDAGNPINEPLLVMRSMSVEDAREQLDALYKSSPGNSSEPQED
ncbi:DUF2973 domain-containing protein [Funiculus sociatus GB2-A5]|jgi:hypothetical protein|uniref:DUF2973 domain-containing protein n=1 Tax=Funiculus sociatus GB2-A5 TaxID=2933946 RepID=A0ABV0JIC3_9CYAN|nr:MULTISPECIES: DUF2973 domain-containing protein [Cyanophyceae]MBD1922507.1 DUF2973 domain-containing protein [Microcoleus sp. FACHB-831]MBD1932131.1 DUF2973 domain-containing protein [Trichocoleus sp. FACHB-69]MBD2065715.1 DUF2973 domain-containing protein [Trichocoleus sp. FACHB-6]